MKAYCYVIYNNYIVLALITAHTMIEAVHFYWCE